MSRARIGRRLDQVAGALAVPRPAADPEAEALELATEVGEAFGRMAAHHREHSGLSPDEARTRTAEVADRLADRARNCPPSQVSWFDLEAIAQGDPNRALERWEEVKRAARGEVATGQRAARALEGYDSHCWERARFLAVRSELSAAWRPRNAAEQHLIDQMAQWQELVWRWQETMTAYHGLIVNGVSRGNSPDGTIQLPRLSDGEALERAAQMVERFHSLYLRTLRALQEMRRLPPVVVRAAGQVNIGQQQVNVTARGGA